MSSLEWIGAFVIGWTLAGGTLAGDRPVQPTGGDRAGPIAEGDGLEAPLPTGAVIRLGTTRYRPGEVVGNLKLSPDGKKLICGGRASGGGVSVWDAATGKLILRRLQGEEGEFSHDGERLFLIELLPLPFAPPKGKPAADKDEKPTAKVLPVQAKSRNALRIYQLSTGKLLQQIDGSGWLYRFAIAPDERTVALEYSIPNGIGDPKASQPIGFFKTRLELYDLKAGRVMHELGELPQNYAGNGLVRFSVDGKTLIAVSSSKENENKPESTVRRFNVSTGVLKSKTAIPNFFYRVLPNSDGSKALIVGGNSIWDLEKDQVHWASKGELAGIYGFMPDNRTLVGWSSKLKQVAGEDIASQVVHWDMVGDREIRRLPARTSFQAISPDGKFFYGAARTYRWIRYDFESGKEINALDAPTEPPEEIAFSPDGKYVATSGRIWDRITGKCLHLLPGGSRGILFFTADSKSLVYNASNLRRVNTPEGIVAGLNMMDPANGKESTREFEDFARDVNLYYCGLTLSPDGKTLAGPYRLWDWDSGKLIGRLKHDDVQTRRTMFAFSPDSKKVAYFASTANGVQVWNVAENRVINDWPIGDHRYRNLSFVKGGEFVASTYLPPRPPWLGMLRFPEDREPLPPDLPSTMPPMPDAFVSVWDPASGKEKFRVQYPQSEYDGSEMPALFSPDGKLLATASYHDEVVHLRDLASGKEVGQFRCGVKGVLSMAFSPDGQVLAVSAKDTTVLLVDVRKVLTNP